MRLLYSSVIISLLLLGLGPAQARTPELKGLELLAAGIFEEDTSEAGSGEKKLPRYKLIKETDRIPARRGLLFGIQYDVLGEPPGAQVEVEYTITTPGLARPGLTGLLKTVRSVWKRNLGQRHFNGFAFDVDWELVPGTWTMKVWHQEKVLIEKSFEVVRDKE